MVGILRDCGAADAALAAPVASADLRLDTPEQTGTVSFTPLEEMVEGTAYKEWFVRFHVDGRPPSLAYTSMTRRGQRFKPLPGGRIVRGKPW